MGYNESLTNMGSFNNDISNMGYIYIYLEYNHEWDIFIYIYIQYGSCLKMGYIMVFYISSKIMRLKPDATNKNCKFH